jgi:hypothetical protein
MFKFNLKTVLIFVLALALQGCSPSPDERYDTGYSDGYAEGYNTACKIRATMVEGDWEDENYSRGYRAGNAAGIQACRDKG